LWGSDIAGYAGTPTPELFVRWTQFATFTPFMQVHMTSNLGPWDFGPEALEIFRQFAVLRVQLFPYLYDAVHVTARSGLPVIRPMAMAFESDGEAATHIYQYMFGPDLLVAPIHQPGTVRSVYLPRGTWFDYWSGERIDGPLMKEVEAPLSRIPLFVRGGAILPMLPSGVETLVMRHAGMNAEVVSLDDRRVLDVWPGADGELQTWDGITASLRDSVLTLSATPSRPLTLHLRERRLSSLPPRASRVRYDESSGITTVEFTKIEGVQRDE
jgi:alpha-D-xyloside xylohydrolase